jgi:hypothetical protein
MKLFAAMLAVCSVAAGAEAQRLAPRGVRRIGG